LVLAIGFVATETYSLWQQGPWDLPKPGAKGKAPSSSEQTQEDARPPLLASTKGIVDKNLFDPERGAARLQETEVAARTMQRIRTFYLIGTFIVGDKRYALITVPPESGGGARQNLRLKMGEMVEGFRVADIQENRVVLQKGQSTVDLTLDFLRKIEVPAPRRAVVPPAAPAPRAEPRAPAVSGQAMSQHEKTVREGRTQQ
jgi:hypothetical protein